MLYIEIAVVVVLICVNGLLAMSELAVVSSRPSRLSAMGEKGNTGAAIANKLASDPGRFLSTVQIGITLVGVLSGAFSGATLGLRLSNWMISVGVPEGVAGTLGVGLVVALITYGSLIIGELVPKQIALRNPEAVASRVAGGMRILSIVAAPLVWLLDISGKAVLKLLGQSEEGTTKVTDEEIASLIAEAESHGVVESDERKMIAGVMRLADRSVRALMTPRTEIDWIDLHDNKTTLRRKLVETPRSILPVGDGSVDQMVGVIRAREVLAMLIERKPFELSELIQPAPIVHDNTDALDVLTTLKEAETPMALVHDEYGNFEGVVTPADILETIVGAFRSDLDDEEEPSAIEREDGSWLLAGYLPTDEMAEILHIELPEKRDYETLAGFVLSHMHKLPEIGEYVDALGWRFEVVDLDGRRIDKILATRSIKTHRGMLPA
ncbi:hemolysin family protein [Aquamicrobium zhengzhouense]|uniref:HlyC/CorC family transporter n=1 Tax=Aquamicrobium zhengzhouense TaxID=2781738 RepID=A0ABS0S9Q8_9HYPH|nr:hemolysin family protein [Aquamicrobium zhengzhouense]MBI1619966.1 HlyC/CorC family transporter [Aquamicrobium zhengzhouense]